MPGPLARVTANDEPYTYVLESPKFTDVCVDLVGTNSEPEIPKIEGIYRAFGPHTSCYHDKISERQTQVHLAIIRLNPD